jgi:alpha-galactosidase
MKGRDAEEAAFNMANALLLRIHQSGHLAEITDEQFSIVQEGISVYKEIREDITQFIPFWPFGFLPLREQNAWYSFGNKVEGANRAYLVVWRLASPDGTATVPISFLQNKEVKAELIFPKGLPVEYQWHPAAGQLAVKLPTQHSARVFRLEW